MNALNLSIGIESLGWTLLHFIWQGSAIGVVAAIMIRAQRGASPNARYLSACGAMTLMVCVAAATFAWQWNLANRWDSSLAGVNDLTVSVPTDLVADDVTASTAKTNWLGTLSRRLHGWLPSIVMLWAGGVAMLSLRLALSWNSLRRLRSQCCELDEPAWQECFARLKSLLRVHAFVKLRQSDSAGVPMAFGWVKPVVLIPAALVTGLTGPQLEAVLAHELAHINRHDYLVNLLQNAIEVLFFYHPAVWWISSRIRAEREFCCDDIAAAVAGGSLNYGRALTVLEQMRMRPAALALQAAGGSLITRIRRLVGVNPPGTRAGGWPALSSALAVALIVSAIAASRADLAQGQTNDENTSPSKAAAGVEEKQVTGSKRYSVVVLTKRVKPSRVVELIQSLFVDADGKPLPHAPVVAADDQAMATIISASSSKMMDAVVALVKQIDGETFPAPTKTSNNNATNKSEKTETAITAEVQSPAEVLSTLGGPVSITRHPVSNILVVRGAEGDVEQIQRIITQAEGSGAIETSKMAGPVSITRHPESNVLVVRGAQGDVEQILRIIKQAEAGGKKEKTAKDDFMLRPKTGAPPSEQRRTAQSDKAPEDDDLTFKVLELKGNNQDAVVRMIEKRFPELVDFSDPDGPRVSKSDKGSAIVVRGKSSQVQKIVQYAASLENDRVLKTVQLRRLPADAVAQTIQELVKGASKAGEKEGFQVKADVANNRVLLRANEIELEEVSKLLRQLGEVPDDDKARKLPPALQNREQPAAEDKAGPPPGEVQTAAISIDKHDAESVMSSIKAAFPQVNDPIDDAPQVRAIAGAKIIVVRAKPAQLKQIRDFVRNLENPRNVKVVQLRRMRAEEMVKSIQQLMKGGTDFDGAGFFVTADVDNNRLLLRANNQEEEQVMQLVHQLDETSGEEKSAGLPR